MTGIRTNDRESDILTTTPKVTTWITPFSNLDCNETIKGTVKKVWLIANTSTQLSEVYAPYRVSQRLHLLSKLRHAGLHKNSLSVVFQVIVVTYALLAWYGQLLNPGHGTASYFPEVSC